MKYLTILFISLYSSITYAYIDPTIRGFLAQIMIFLLGVIFFWLKILIKKFNFTKRAKKLEDLDKKQ